MFKFIFNDFSYIRDFYINNFSKYFLIIILSYFNFSIINDAIGGGGSPTPAEVCTRSIIDSKIKERIKILHSAKSSGGSCYIGKCPIGIYNGSIVKEFEVRNDCHVVDREESCLNGEGEYDPSYCHDITSNILFTKLGEKCILNKIAVFRRGEVYRDIYGCNGKVCSDYNYRLSGGLVEFCTPYDPPVPSWGEIENKAREYESDANVSYNINNVITEDIKNRYELFDLDDSNNLGQYVSCGDSGRIKKTLKTRNTLSNFKYCTKWKLGIDKNYVGNVGLSDNKPEQIDPNKFKVFCESVSYTNTSPSTTGFNSNSISSSTKHVCRDGIIKDGDGSCNVPTHLEMKLCKKYETRQEYCNKLVTDYGNCEKWAVGGEKFGGRRCIEYGIKTIEVPCLKYWTYYTFCDASTYDTNKIKFYEYNIDICVNPSIDGDKLRNGIKLQPTYDPNMVYY